jgi:60 kDa SS-A/Ro ribonucleoprotein
MPGPFFVFFRKENSMRAYRGLGSRNAVTPQSEPVPGSDQVQNNAGGFTWAIDDWARLERFLILGSEGGTYYVDERKLTKASAACVTRCIKQSGPRTVAMIAAISEAGRAPKTDPALLALAMCASPPSSDATRALAFKLLPKVARTGTHLLHFIAFAEEFRGWGKGMRKAVGAWFNDKAPIDVAYQVTKYPSRDKWSMSDALRLAHPKPATLDHGRLYKYIVDGEYSSIAPGKTFLVEGESGLMRTGDWPTKKYMYGVLTLQGLKGDPKGAAKCIADFKLPREVVPTELLTSPDVWEALLQHMPVTALVRNLATMTRVGLITMLSPAAQKVCLELADAERIRKSRIHPIQILAAMLTYQAGHGNRGQNTWTPVQRIVDALDGAFYTAFGNVESSGARTLIALDVSGSMQDGEVGGVLGLTPMRAEAAMAMVTARVEPQHGFIAFSAGTRQELRAGRGSYNAAAMSRSAVTPMDVSPKMRLNEVVAHMDTYPMSGTDCSLPMIWAKENKVMVDTFVIYTDNETWAGNIHPHQALRQYRDATGIPAKCIVVGMTASEFSIADPNDSGMLDVVGFDTATPNVISQFSRPVNAAFEPVVWQGEQE